MSDRYDPDTLEPKWQSRWEEEAIHRIDLDEAERPFFNLMMYPYPSGEGLHVGNVYAFTGADIHGRFKRLQGLDVFEPIGFDAFGIHSENFALDRRIHPMELIPRNVANFTRQLKRMGFMYDWSRTVNTTDPDYYRWTQWIFLQLFNAGLAERRMAPVNWCPSCMTVLANEQVIDGRCERCDTEVTQRQLNQWFFRITDYTERLLENLEWIDWSSSTKRLQSNWIGRSEGADIEFEVVAPSEGEVIRVFTTRPDTLFGATFMVLAPEHPLVERVTTPEQKAAVEEYVEQALSMDLVERRKAGEQREKTGIDTGARAINPATGAETPVWVADYVLMEYGHGAIMAVPAHDERDFEFARKYDLAIRQVVAPADAPDDDADDDAEIAFTEHTENEVLVNSGDFTGMPAPEAARAITQWLEERDAGEGTVNYRIHDWCISRQRYWGPPIPVIHCDACGIVPVPEDDLPVELPYVEDFRPDESGVGPLARAREFYEVECPACGGAARRETDVSDTFLDSSWYFLRYPSTEFDDRPFDPDRTKKWLPVDMYIGGEEHAVLHLMYSRFIIMALHDLGHLEFEEPYLKFRKHGLIVREGAKMSKSRGNVVNPDEYVERYGADVFRTYLMFLGSYEEGGDFREQGISGISRFFDRVWDAIVPTDELGDGPPETEELEQRLHATIQKVTEDLKDLQFNTAIAAMMEYLNEVRYEGRTGRRSELEPLVVLLAPFAPHLADELWERLGHDEPLFVSAEWPEFDPEKAVTDEVEIAVQVNGKLRATIKAARGAPEDEVRERALAEEAVRRHLDGQEIRKTIFVPDRLINLVIG